MTAAAFPVAAPIIGAVGLLAWGASTIYSNRKTIAKGLKATGDAVSTGAKKVGNAIADTGKKVGNGLKKVGNWLKKW